VIPFALKALAVFLLVFTLDFVWAGYTKAITQHRRLSACVFSALIYVVGALSTIGYVSNPWLILPAVIGGMAGTWVYLWLEDIWLNDVP
jgi:uncharacterized metal-binding protein